MELGVSMGLGVICMIKPSLEGVNALNDGLDDGGMVKVVGQLSCLLMVVTWQWMEAFLLLLHGFLCLFPLL
jgi:hypothetical protein